MRNKPNVIIDNIEKYSPTLYSLSSFELKLIRITKAVDNKINTLKKLANGSRAIVPIKRLVTSPPPNLIANKVRDKPPSTHHATLNEFSLR